MTEFIQVSQTVTEKLFVCTTKDEVTDVFAKYEIKNIPDKIGLLRLCMGAKSVSASVGSITDEEEYDDELLMFLDGTWRFLS
jgi:hypothetical protein